MRRNTMKAGVAQVNITPPVGIPQRGAASRKNVAQGIHDDLYAQALVLDDGQTAAVIITTDLIGMDRRNTGKIRKRIEQDTGIPRSCVLICGSHTHCGPVLSPTLYFKDEKMRAVDEAWVGAMRRQIAGAVYMAKTELKEARVGAGTGRIEKGIAGSKVVKLKDGRFVLWKKDLGLTEDDIIDQGPFDPEVGVLKVEEPDGTPVVLLANYACHAEVAGTPLLFSADYPGVMRRVIRKVEGDRLVVMFAQGAAGNIYANRYLRGDWPANGFLEMERIGTMLAGEVIKVMEQIVMGEGRNILAAQAAAVMAPLNERIQSGETSDLTLTHFINAKAEDIRNDKVETEVQVIRIDDTVIVALPGEPFVEIGLALKETILSRHRELRNVFIIGYANDYEVGCFPSTEAYTQPREVTGYATTVGTVFGKGAAGVIIDCVLSKVAHLFQSKEE
jgi:hypothetical protein